MRLFNAMENKMTRLNLRSFEEGISGNRHTTRVCSETVESNLHDRQRVLQLT